MDFSETTKEVETKNKRRRINTAQKQKNKVLG